MIGLVPISIIAPGFGATGFPGAWEYDFMGDERLYTWDPAIMLHDVASIPG